MTRFLNGAELAGYIKERQAKQVSALRQAHSTTPKLAIVQTRHDPVIDKYVGLKKAYGDDILVEVESHAPLQDEALELVKKLNQDDSVHGIIIQLPLEDTSQTDELVNAVAPEKDVDGLGKQALWDPATPMAINWLLTGYNVELRGKQIAIVGKGRLVGGPLADMWQGSNLDVTVLTKNTEDIGVELKKADIIVTAAGSPGLITSDMIPLGAVVVDAATSSESGKIVGDVAPDVRKRSDLTITPERGGVGPLTVTALFDNVIRAARKRVETF
jgi:methylenetetrahydrofolate dehydrogenase (NADP+) / methenyltetrahydrofolate cyclohydrolase